MMLSISDWLAWSVAQAAKTDSRPNACWNDGIEPHAGVHLGFALNQSNGELIVPVIHGADGLAFEDFVARIKGLQKTAVRRKLRPEDVTGGTISVTSLIGTGVHQVNPIIVPGQAAILALGDSFSVGGAQFYMLTIAFDHRVLNGAEAAAFLLSVATLLEESYR